MLKKLRIPQLLRPQPPRPLLSLTSTTVSSNSSFKDFPSTLMRTVLEDSSRNSENFPNANFSVPWEDQREKLSLSSPNTNMLEKLLLVLTKKTLMEEPSGLNSVDKLLVDTNHKLEPAVSLEEMVRQTPFSLVTSDSEPSNGPSRSSSRSAEPSTVSESP